MSLEFAATVMAYQAVMQGEKLRKGPWHEEEDELLITFVNHLGERRWDYIAKASGLKRSGKSCRLRWLNYLRPDIKHGHISTEEEQIILQLHEQWGNKWSKIAQRLPGRTDNEIKNYWRTHLRKKMQAQRDGSAHVLTENFPCGRNNATQDFLFQKVDFHVQQFEADNSKPVEDTYGSGNTSFDAPGFSNLEYTTSPYENRLFDWIKEFSSDESKVTHQEDSNSTESCFSYQGRISEDTDIWGWSGSIWDMN